MFAVLRRLDDSLEAVGSHYRILRRCVLLRPSSWQQCEVAWEGDQLGSCYGVYKEDECSPGPRCLAQLLGIMHEMNKMGHGERVCAMHGHDQEAVAL